MKHKLSKLESLRGMAALYVFAGHLFTQRLLDKNSAEGFIFRFGQEAVMIFFIISGFVIYLSIANSSKKLSFSSYFIKRWCRIYPIFLLALILSVWVSDVSEPTLNIKTTIGNLLMLQDFATGKPGVWFSPLGANAAIWSLSYEWWFYMMFYPVFKFVPVKLQLHTVGAISVIGFLSYSIFPNQISLFLMSFILWWSGAETARRYIENTEITYRAFSPVFFWLATVAAFQLVPVILSFLRHEPHSLGMHPILELRSTIDCIALIAIAIAWKKGNWMFFSKTVGPFSKIAPISYAIYVFHWPLAIAPTYLAVRRTQRFSQI